MRQKTSTKKTGRRRATDTGRGSIPYKLVFDERGVGFAKLSSPLLDPSMHEGGTLRVLIDGIATGEHADVLAIDSFQVDSLVEYLASQGAIRDELNNAVYEHLAAARKRGLKIGRGAAIWKVVKVSLAVFAPCDAHAQESVEALRRLVPGMTDESFAAKRDAAERARSEFEMYLSGPWPDEHERCAHFRDGQLVSFHLQG
jgi:hypothetical protein